MIWAALAVMLLTVVVSAVWMVRRGIEAYRAFTVVGRAAGAELERISTASGQIERHLALAAESGTALSASVERLSRSRAQLTVLTSALADVRAAVGQITSFYPRK